jgi:hypothetical protein
MSSCGCIGYRREVRLETEHGWHHVQGEVTTVCGASIVLGLPGSDTIVEEKRYENGTVEKICDIKALQQTVSGAGLEYYIKIACIVSFLRKRGVELFGLKTEPSCIALCSEDELEELYLSAKKSAEKAINDMPMEQFYIE